jgi:hypothetical protein
MGLDRFDGELFWRRMRGGSHGIKNNASKATKNCSYIIDIITLL